MKRKDLAVRSDWSFMYSYAEIALDALEMAPKLDAIPSRVTGDVETSPARPEAR